MDAENKHKVIEGYVQFVQNLTDVGWTPYLMTFMFENLGGSPDRVARQMEAEVERIYATFVTRVTRKPRSAAHFDHMPVWLSCPDYPVPKREKKSVRDVIINDGRHKHALALQPPKSRLREDLVTHFNEHWLLYVRPKLPISRIDVEPITHDLARVVDYNFKAFGRGLVGSDEILILHRSSTEMHGRRP